MDVIFLLTLALTVVAAVVVYTQLMGKKPEPVEIISGGGSSPGKRKPKKKAEAKKQESFKWDQPEPAAKGKKTKETDRMFDPIAAGKEVIAQTKKSEEESKSKEQPLTQKQRNRLQSQGFVSVEDKKPKRGKSAEKVEDDDDDDDLPAGMSSETAERLKLLERIASGGRAYDDYKPGDRKGGDKKLGVGQERRVDHDIVRQRLDEQKQQKKAEEEERTKPRGGRINFQGQVAQKPQGGGSAWARTSAAPAADAAPAPAPAADGDDDAAGDD